VEDSRDADSLLAENKRLLKIIEENEFNVRVGLHNSDAFNAVFWAVRVAVANKTETELRRALTERNHWTLCCRDGSADFKTAMNLIDQIQKRHGWYVQLDFCENGARCVIDLGGFDYHTNVQEVSACGDGNREQQIVLAVYRAALTALIVEEQLAHLSWAKDAL